MLSNAQKNFMRPDEPVPSLRQLQSRTKADRFHWKLMKVFYAVDNIMRRRQVSCFVTHRKETIVNLGTAETKLLYTLHWVLLDAAEEQLLVQQNPNRGGGGYSPSV
jgi:hypothetical protein